MNWTRVEIAEASMSNCAEQMLSSEIDMRKLVFHAPMVASEVLNATESLSDHSK